MHVRNWSWPLPTVSTKHFNRFHEIVPWTKLRHVLVTSRSAVVNHRIVTCYCQTFFNPNSLQWPFFISEELAIFVLCVTRSAQPFWVYSFEWLLMDRTDLKGYFINLAHPEVNMAHIQLTEVVAPYPAPALIKHTVPSPISPAWICGSIRAWAKHCSCLLLVCLSQCLTCPVEHTRTLKLTQKMYNIQPTYWNSCILRQKVDTSQGSYQVYVTTKVCLNV